MISLTAIKQFFFTGYKSYQDINQIRIPEINNFNVIIGKNNSGKSSFIDIIEALISHTTFLEEPHISTDIRFSIYLDAEHIKEGFSPQHQSDFQRLHEDDYTFGLRFVGHPLEIKLTQGRLMCGIGREFLSHGEKEAWQLVASSYVGDFSKYKLLKILAERDIQPEKEDFNLKLDSNGVGASNLIRGFINQSQYNERLIEQDLLQALNYIMREDAYFSRIQVQQIQQKESPVWEIFLEEKEAGRFALSRSGSGLKTIILVLLNLLIVPKLPENKDKLCIFAFEELENNLHPALQRRLFDCLYRFSINNHVPIFLTTHSHIAIDMFCSRQRAQVLHVTKKNHISAIKHVDNMFDKIKILEDLCVKASDLFQSNGIIWVEGPSDRIYINQWLKIFCDSKYQEGRDFQYLYYGGRLLSHYSAEDSIELLNKINILTTNHNSAVVIDSDKKNKRDNINTTKQRIQREFQQKHLFCWITAGKEIENYLPVEAINRVFPENPLSKQCLPFAIFPNYIKKVDSSFASHKVDFANKIAPYITAENSVQLLDLKRQIEALYHEIERWNASNNAVAEHTGKK